MKTMICPVSWIIPKDFLSTIEDNQSMSNIPAVKQRLNMLRETLDDIQDHYTTSIDEDARVGHKSEDSSFFGYKTHIP